MNEGTGIVNQFKDSANEFWTSVADYLPKVIGALLLLVLAVIVAKLAQAAVVRVLDMLGVNKLTKNKTVSKSLRTAEINVDFVEITGRIVFWVIIIIFALMITDVLGLTAMGDVINSLLGYLPSVLAAAIVLTVTIAGARLVRDVVTASLHRMRVDFGQAIGNVTFYLIMVFGTLMAVDQLGFDTTVIATNINIIVSGFVLALALAFGLGGRDIASRVLEDAYTNLRKSRK